MAKRFTDTMKWNEDWFLELSTSNKLFWIYVCDNCDHAGIYKLNKRMFELLIGAKINTDDFLTTINAEKDRIILLDNGKWYITKFIEFQYGPTLNPNNRVHKSILTLLIKNAIIWSDEDKAPKLELGEPNEPKKETKPVPKGNPESIEEVKAYFQEKGSNKKEGEKFYYFYESKGWKVGKESMKNWKMAAKGWISRNKKNLPDSDYLGGQLKAMRK